MLSRKMRRIILERMEALDAGVVCHSLSPRAAVLQEGMAALSALYDTLEAKLAAERFEHYREVMDGLLQALQALQRTDSEEITVLSHELLRWLIDEIGKEPVKKEIVFLPYKASMWDSLESIWQAAIADEENCNVHVVAIPYATLTSEREVKEWHCEKEMFPSYVPIIDYQTIDLEALHPDVIFIHNPYDECNFVTSVKKCYYSRELKKITELLAYVPYFISDEVKPGKKDIEYALSSYIVRPGVLTADRVIVQSEDMRQIYINLLSRYTSMEDRNYWAKRIFSFGSPKIDKVIMSRKEDFALPETWTRIVKGRRILLYNTGLDPLLAHTSIVCKKLRCMFAMFRERSDIALWWRPHPLTQATIKSMRPEIEGEYSRLVQSYIDEGWGIYDDSADLHRAICWSDAYYGDASSVVYLYRYTRKPMLLQDGGMFPIYAPYWMFGVAIEYDAEKFWFQAAVTNGILSMNMADGKVKLEHVFSEHPFISEHIWGYSLTFRVGSQLLFAPFIAESLIVYDTDAREEYIVPLPDMDGAEYGGCPRFYGGAHHDGSIFLYGRFPAVVEYHLDSREVEYHPLTDDFWEMLSNAFIYHNPQVEHQGKLWFVPAKDNIVVSFDYESKALQRYMVGEMDKQYRYIASDGEFLWLYDRGANILQWHPVTGEYLTYALPKEMAEAYFSGMICTGKILLLLPNFEYPPACKRVCFDIKTKQVEILLHEGTGRGGYIWMKALKNDHVLAYEPHKGEFHEYDADGNLWKKYVMDVDEELLTLWRRSLMNEPKKILYEHNMIDLATFLSAAFGKVHSGVLTETLPTHKTCGELVWKMIKDSWSGMK